jgi:four helix bundle protein
MSAVKSFTELRFWQRARQLSKAIFRLTKNETFRRDRRLVAQINDSSESVMANVAEGFGSGAQGEFVTFLGYAVGSLNETQSHLCAAYDREYLSQEDFARLFQVATEIRKLSIAFIQSMTRPGSGSNTCASVRVGRTKFGNATNDLPASHGPSCTDRVHREFLFSSQYPVLSTQYSVPRLVSFPTDQADLSPASAPLLPG